MGPRIPPQPPPAASPRPAPPHADRPSTPPGAPAIRHRGQPRAAGGHSGVAARGGPARPRPALDADFTRPGRPLVGQARLGGEPEPPALPRPHCQSGSGPAARLAARGRRGRGLGGASDDSWLRRAPDLGGVGQPALLARARMGRLPTHSARVDRMDRRAAEAALQPVRWPSSQVPGRGHGHRGVERGKGGGAARRSGPALTCHCHMNM